MSDARRGLAAGLQHLAALEGPLGRLRGEVDKISAWGRDLAGALSSGRRLLAAGNGGSAAQAGHLTAELVGRYCDDRMPFSALALHADTSSVTAICNDYGVDEVFARQVRAHGRPGDIFVALSTSGSSPNMVAAAKAAVDMGMTAWAMTGPSPNALLEVCDDGLSVDCPETSTVQEIHLVVVHLLCAAVDIEVGASPALAPVDSEVVV
jgi:D-sedoheptulose 7-phosphate isomerase